MRKLITFTLTFLIWVLAARPSLASPPQVTLTPGAAVGPTVNGWEASTQKGIELQFSGSGSPLELEWVNMRSAGCSMPVGAGTTSLEASNPDCNQLLEPALSSVQVKWKAGAYKGVFEVSWPEETKHAIELASSGKPHKLKFSTAVGHEWWTFDSSGAWVKHTSTQANTVPGTLASQLQAQGGNLVVVSEVSGQLVRVPIVQHNATTLPYAPLSDADFSALCEQQRQKLAPAKQTENNEKNKRRKAVHKKDWGYVVCVDWTGPVPRTEVLTTRYGADPAAEAGHVHLYEGRPVHTRIWHRNNETVTTTASGTRGSTNFTYIQTFVGQGAGVAAGAPAQGKVRRTPTAGKDITGFKGGQVATLNIKKVTGAGKNAVEQLFSYDFEVTAVYTSAIRIGFSGVWAPFDRSYVTRESGVPGNPGRQIATEGGLDSDLAYLELVTGYSFFFTPVYEGENTVTGGFLLGVGVLGNSKEGIDAFSSVHAGLELDVGRDFSVAATVSLRRTQVLRDGYFVGRSVGADETYTRFGVTPAFGLVLTWSPDFTKALGHAVKVK